MRPTPRWDWRQAIQTQAVVIYDVVIKVDNSDLKLKPGMTANVTIITANKKGVLKIPNAALRFIPPEEVMAKAPQKGYGVWVLGEAKAGARKNNHRHQR